MTIKAKQYLEKVTGKLTFGSAIRSIRLCEEASQTAFAKKLKVPHNIYVIWNITVKLLAQKKLKEWLKFWVIPLNSLLH
jgi:hypothetical protein